MSQTNLSVTGRGVRDLELESPAVDGDQLVAPDGFSMPLADVLMLEVQRFDAARTIFRVGGGGLSLFTVWFLTYDIS